MSAPSTPSADPPGAGGPPPHVTVVLDLQIPGAPAATVLTAPADAGVPAPPPPAPTPAPTPTPPVTLSETQKKAFDTITETTKQLITLGTAILAVTVTFSKDIIKPDGAPVWLMRTAWVLYLGSITFGVFTLMAIAGTLANAAAANQPANPKEWSIRQFQGLQIATFMFATLFIICFGWNLTPPAQSNTTSSGQLTTTPAAQPPAPAPTPSPGPSPVSPKPGSGATHP